ncbi:CHAT domain-containing protein [Nakamurella deserti]|uniref:CHAT domain-containing protein n=1 Tax=Nakamurella deserti TaxID=2164074 RepID=UPI0013001CA4|nr:CHAT domain-containing protein [Nakamurella deserti]
MTSLVDPAGGVTDPTEPPQHAGLAKASGPPSPVARPAAPPAPPEPAGPDPTAHATPVGRARAGAAAAVAPRSRAAPTAHPDPADDPDPAGLAAAALDEVGRDPRHALTLADRAVSVAHRDHDTAAAATAHRAAALALRELGDLSTAERRVRNAVRAAVRAGASATAAEARMTLAFLLLEAGRARAALHQADLAVHASTGLAAARAASQRALVLQRIGRLDEALAGYGDALPVFRRHHDRLWEARLLNNRGRLHTDRGDLARAAADLSGSRALLLDAGMTSLAADAAWNLAVVATLAGDIPLALARFDDVHTEHVARGTPNPQLRIDRAETLLVVGLTGEAVAEAAAAVDAVAAAGPQVDLPHALLVLAQAHAAHGDHAAAAEAARRARRLFRRQHRHHWAALADLTALRAAEPAAPPAAPLLRDALRTADRVRRIGWPLAEMDARLIAARAAARRGDTVVRREQLTRAAELRRLGTVDSRLRGWYARALLADELGDRRGFRVALRAGLRVLDEQQALLGATELRVAVSAVGADLVGLGLGHALAAGRARDVLRWADLGRARATRPRPARPPQDAALTRALATVRQLHAHTVAAQLDGDPAPPAAERRRAEQEVVAVSRTAAGPGAPADAATPELLAATLGDAVLTEFVEHGGQLYRVDLSDGRFSLHRLGPLAELPAQIAHVHFGLRRLTTGFGTGRSRRATDDALRAAAARLGARLFDGADPDLSRPVVVVPSATVHAVPWALLPGLWPRPFLVAPSAAAWYRATVVSDAAGSGAGRDRAARVPVLVAGPGLPAAVAEIAALHRVMPTATVLTPPHATTDAVLTALDGAPLAHLAVHGLLRTDNPLFSALLLDDGPLTIYDLERLRAAPGTVVLPSCRSGVSATRAGDELLGLVAALLSLGARTVVATALETPDGATGALMELFHRELAAGCAPPAALARVRGAVDPGDLALAATAAGFTCFGGSGTGAAAPGLVEPQAARVSSTERH